MVPGTWVEPVISKLGLIGADTFLNHLSFRKTPQVDDLMTISAGRSSNSCLYIFVKIIKEGKASLAPEVLL